MACSRSAFLRVSVVKFGPLLVYLSSYFYLFFLIFIFYLFFYTRTRIKLLMQIYFCSRHWEQILSQTDISIILFLVKRNFCSGVYAPVLGELWHVCPGEELAKVCNRFLCLHLWHAEGCEGRSASCSMSDICPPVSVSLDQRVLARTPARHNAKVNKNPN